MRRGRRETTGPQGDDGREVELQTTATHVQWRYVGDLTWLDLTPLSVISGGGGVTTALYLPGVSGNMVSIPDGASLRITGGSQPWPM